MTRGQPWAQPRGPRRTYRAPIVGREWLSDISFRLELERPDGFSFRAGQSIRITEAGAERDYSLASSPSDPRLELCVRLVENGRVSSVLGAAPRGTFVSYGGPDGYFTFRGSERPSVFVATGVGVAPFLSMLRAGASGFTMLHGVRSRRHLSFEGEFRAAACRYVGCVTADAGAGHYGGRVTAWAAAHLQEGCYDFYLCGNRHMVRDFTLLVDDRFRGSRVYTEVFH